MSILVLISFSFITAPSLQLPPFRSHPPINATALLTASQAFPFLSAKISIYHLPANRFLSSQAILLSPYIPPKNRHKYRQSTTLRTNKNHSTYQNHFSHHQKPLHLLPAFTLTNSHFSHQRPRAINYHSYHQQPLLPPTATPTTNSHSPPTATHHQQPLTTNTTSPTTSLHAGSNVLLFIAIVVL